MSAERLIAEMMADTPRALYPMADASGNPVDVSGNSLGMTGSAGTPTYQEGFQWGGKHGIRLGSTARFTRANISTQGTNFTCELWFKLNSTADFRMLLLGTNADGGGGMRLDLRSSGTKLAFVYPFVADHGTTAFTFAQNTWYHAAFTKGASGSATLYYVNGELDSTKGTDDPQAPTTNWRIKDSTSAGDVTYGPVAWYHTQLSAARIRAHYAAGTWLAGQVS
jgi:hypothetical protein